MKFPVKLQYPRDGKPPKEIFANSQSELEGLIRIGWKVIE
jgi:hypothetical protein